MVSLILLGAIAKTSESSSPRFEISVAPGLVSSPQNGRLFVVVSLKGQQEPRLTVGETGLDAPPFFGRDINGFAPACPA
jgi:hypothetical protein